MTGINILPGYSSRNDCSCSGATGGDTRAGFGGRVTNKLDQAGVEILRYAYDPNSRLTNRWSKAKGNTIYSYDPVGNLTNVNYPTSTDVRFAYDPPQSRHRNGGRGGRDQVCLHHWRAVVDGGWPVEQ